MLATDVIPSAYMEHAKRIASALSKLEHVIICAHVNPDGDAVGALQMGYFLLQALDKDCVIYSSTGIPEFLEFQKFPAPVYTSLAALPFHPESALLVDCGEYHRLGKEAAAFIPNLPSINVDHHEGSGMGSVASWIEPKAAATTCLLAYIALVQGLPLSGALGRACALGVVTDTGGFAHSNTTCEVFRLCAHLAEAGVDFASLRDQLEHCLSMERLLLWGDLTRKIKLLAQGRLAFCAVSQEDLAARSATRDDLEGFVEYLRKLKGVQISALVREDETNVCKFSLRSCREIDVCTLAQQLHGGGHRNASGGTLHTNLDQAQQKLESILVAAFA
ncbi:MAG: DHH family phosphoesterase [Desulfovibrionaceae bacterium]|nr:DHH family phosphoesterase [Desulfovibrionaceae bacterium]